MVKIWPTAHLNFSRQRQTLLRGVFPSGLGLRRTKDVIVMEDIRDTGRGTRTAAIGSILGIVPAVALGFLRFVLAEEPARFSQLAGHIAFTLVYLAPYALVLIARAAPNPGVRGGLLLALGLLSLAASFSPTTLAFLPATFVIWFAAVRSLTAARPLLATTLPAMVAGLFIAATVGFGFYTLLLAQDAEPRCWAQTRGPDGQSRWESRPDPQSPGALRITISGSGRSFCTSDVITNTEAATSIGVLAAAFLIMSSIVKFRRVNALAGGSH